jgi:hypothetical protein
VFTLNRVPTKSVEGTPYEIWIEKRPRLSFLRFWGCEAYVKYLMSDNLTPKSDKCFFVWYLREIKEYYFYNKAEGKVFVARNGVFMEKEFLSGSKVQLEDIQETPKNISAPTNPIQEVQDVVPPDVEAPAPHRSIRARCATKKFTLITMKQCDILLLDNDEIMTYMEAMMGPNSEKWLGALESEIQSMHDNQVWNLVDPINGMRPMSCKWVFKKKSDKDENVHIYKTRLVAKGFKHIHYIDYDETFSHVMMVKSVRILLSIAAYFDYEIWQMDVKTAFLMET